MREFKGVARGVLLGALLIFIMWLLISCGGDTTSFEEIESREMTPQEMTWWTEVGNCLVNKGLAFHGDVIDVPPPIIHIAAEPFTCGGTDHAGECASRDWIILYQGIVGEVDWFKHGACHTYEGWLEGRDGHSSNWWVPRGQGTPGCVCENNILNRG